MKKLYVGNLPYSATEDSLRGLFEAYEPIESVRIITDKFSGRSKGFGFVELSDDSKASQAIEELHEKEVDGRNIQVNEARPLEPRSGGGGERRGGGGGDRRGGGGGRGGYGGGGERRGGGGDRRGGGGNRGNGGGRGGNY